MKKFLFAVILILCFASIGHTAGRYKDSDWQHLLNVPIPDIWNSNWSYEEKKANGYYGNNCFYFVDHVISDEKRGSLLDKTASIIDKAYIPGYDDYIVVSSDGITKAQYLKSDNDGIGPTSKDVSEKFSMARSGDIVQMYWYSTQHTALIDEITEDGVVFFQAHTNDELKISHTEFLTWEKLAELYRNAYKGKGGFTIYRIGNPTMKPTLETSLKSQIYYFVKVNEASEIAIEWDYSARKTWKKKFQRRRFRNMAANIRRIPRRHGI